MSEMSPFVNTQAKKNNTKPKVKNPEPFEESGTVKWFESKMNYGFIIPDDGSTDIFIHSKVLKAFGLETLKEGTKLKFKAVKAARGMQVTEILELIYR